MGKYVYLFELDSVRKTDEEVAIGQEAICREILVNGNTVVLTYNQLVDSRAFFSLMDDEGYYSELIRLFESGYVKVSQYGDIRTIVQYLLNCLSRNDGYIFSSWPLKASQKRLLAMIRRSLTCSDLTEIENCRARTDPSEILDVFAEIVDGEPIPTKHTVGECKAILKNLSCFLRTILRLSAIHTIYVGPKPDDGFGMSFQGYLDRVLCLVQEGPDAKLWKRSTEILAEVRRLYDLRTDDRSAYHHALKCHNSKGPKTSAFTRACQYAEAIVDLCYNYQLEYSICNTSKHYNLEELDSQEPSDWPTFTSDFFSRLEQTWQIGDHENRYLLDETDQFDEYKDRGKAIYKLLTRTVRMAEKTCGKGGARTVPDPSKAIHRYEYALKRQRSQRYRELMSSINRLLGYAFICFVIALAMETTFEFLQDRMSEYFKQWVDIDSMAWKIPCYALEVLFVFGLSEFISILIKGIFPDFMSLSDALQEIISLCKDRWTARKLYRSADDMYRNRVKRDLGSVQDYQAALRIEYLRSDPIKAYMKLQASRPTLFAPSDIDQIADLTAADTRDGLLKELSQIEELYGYRFGVVYRSEYNTMIVDPIVNGKPTGPTYKPFERVVPTSGVDGVVMIPRYRGRFILIRQFRHAIRTFQYAFPRGHAERGGLPSGNAERELDEEIHGKVIGEPLLLNRVATDSGLTSAQPYIYLVDIESYEEQIGHEGIVETIELTEQQVDDRIRSGEISDGFTLSAWLMYKLKRS